MNERDERLAQEVIIDIASNGRGTRVRLAGKDISNEVTRLVIDVDLTTAALVIYRRPLMSNAEAPEPERFTIDATLLGRRV